MADAKFRSVTHGTCTLGGRHATEEYVGECPALGKSPRERIARFRAQNGPTHTDIAGRPDERPSDRASPVDLGRFSLQPGAHKGGRPRKYPTRADARRGSRDRVRAYRTRRQLP